jgi:hypothetical protein
MTVKRHRPRDIVVHAMQLMLGTTTKQQILNFCPDANVGAIGPSPDSVDLRWVMIPTHDGMLDAIDGDYIIKSVTGGFFLRKPEHFKPEYEELD